MVGFHAASDVDRAHAVVRSQVLDADDAALAAGEDDGELGAVGGAVVDPARGLGRKIAPYAPTSGGRDVAICPSTSCSLSVVARHFGRDGRALICRGSHVVVLESQMASNVMPCSASIN